MRERREPTSLRTLVIAVSEGVICIFCKPGLKNICKIPGVNSEASIGELLNPDKLAHIK